MPGKLLAWFVLAVCGAIAEVRCSRVLNFNQKQVRILCLCDLKRFDSFKAFILLSDEIQVD